MYKRKEVRKLTGSEEFIHTGDKKFTVLDFWRYGFSNLNSNVLRGALAEYIVETALKDVEDIEIRNPWGDYDVDYQGKTIEVKCCSYLQDWDQLKLSTIQWSGLKANTLYWNDAVAKQIKQEKKEYKAQIYVLALLNHKETETLNILDMDQWCFYVLSKDKLQSLTKDGSSVSLSLLKKNGIESVAYHDLKVAIEA
ncbi:hypothetical protein CL652_02560 [bacterium]|nr:hypothetical protein [bacterium]|tara:strand:+ start:14384 stop:14971 length:588 start_codon:yes stop_codon:yes gene_type:complete